MSVTPAVVVPRMEESPQCQLPGAAGGERSPDNGRRSGEDLFMVFLVFLFPSMLFYSFQSKYFLFTYQPWRRVDSFFTLNI